VALVTVGAAVLRLLHIDQVSPDPFYDAAVRSMGLSWHNFFFGAFEPGGSMSIDKPPVDLWLQVASVKLFGFSSTTLKLPEAFAGIASVPLLFAAVRRMWSTPAAIAAAITMAVLPVEVITSRSDTMDGVMMALIVLALLFVVRAGEHGSTAWLLAAAATLGLAFDVKLLESLVALPGLAVLAYLGLPGSRRTRLLQLGAATAVYVVVALAWLTATLLAPAHDRPYAIGSTNGSAWNAAFVFNGTERLGGKSPEPQFTVYEPGRHYPEATQSQRDHIPIVPPSPTRLLARIGPLSGERLGLVLLVALLLGIPALLWGVWPRKAARPDDDAGVDAAVDAGPPARSETDRGGPAAGDRERVRRAAAVGLSVWLLTGIVLFSYMARLHPRYVEALTPAVAAVAGIGVAWAASGRGWARLIALVVGLVAVVYYVERLLYGTTGVWWLTVLAALAALALTVLAQADLGAAPGASTGGGRGILSTSRPVLRLLSGATIALTLVAVLALPLSADVTAINTHVTDAGYVGALPTEEQQALSAYLRAHQGTARYEVAAESATQIGSLIVQDARPILILTSYGGRVFTTVAELKQLIAQGKVRYAFLNSHCGPRSSASNAACSAPARWVRAHGTDVSGQAGVGHAKVLWLLPGATA
jgi:4-amino-4-deoxy-L-arabinose transferase-like glycosyltransferase